MLKNLQIGLLLFLFSLLMKSLKSSSLLRYTGATNRPFNNEDLFGVNSFEARNRHHRHRRRHYRPHRHRRHYRQCHHRRRRRRRRRLFHC